MKLEYISVHFLLQFEEEPSFIDTPLIFLRSTLGMHLHKMFCASPDTICNTCILKESCKYYSTFESPLISQNFSHPFLMKLNEWQDARTADIEFIFLGECMSLIPQFVSAVKLSGLNGIGKTRCTFSLSLRDNKNQIIEEEKLGQLPVSCWSTQVFQQDMKGSALVQLTSPFRFKIMGNLATDFDANQFFICLNRRMHTLVRLYGEVDDNDEQGSFDNISIKNKNLYWKDYHYYSSRQHATLELGGVMGNFVLEGVFSVQEQALLDFCQLFCAGKNINFGLGNIVVWSKWQMM